MNKSNIKTKKSFALVSLLVALLLVSAFIIIHFVMAKNRNVELIGSEISFPESAGSFSLSNADIECDLDSLREKSICLYCSGLHRLFNS